jgi:hypothetical protein
METNQASDQNQAQQNTSNENQVSSSIATGGEASGLNAGSPAIPDSSIDNPAAARESWEEYEQNPDNPHLSAAEDAEKDTGRPTGAIYGQGGDIMYVSDQFSDTDDSSDTQPADDAAAAEAQPEGNPS